MCRHLMVALLLLAGLTAASAVYADEFKLLMWIEGISGPEDQVRSWIEANNALYHIPDLPPLLQMTDQFPTQFSMDYRPTHDAEMHIDDIVLTKEVDKSTPKLIELCQRGSIIPHMKLALCSQANRQALTFNFEEIKVTYVAVRAPGFGDRSGVTPLSPDRPMVEVGIQFRHVLGAMESYPR